MSQDHKSLGAQESKGRAPQDIDALSLGDQPSRVGGAVDIALEVDDGLEVVDLSPRFTFEKALGQGGMGAVSLYTEKGLERKVAIKRMLGEYATSKEAQQRFFAEAKSIAKVVHPNIVYIHQFGRDAQGLFLIMEYVEGGSLLERCRGGAKISPEKAVEIVCQLCDGLAKAHEMGIIHRDIKPGNVLLTLDGRPKLTDFGLARQETADGGLTRSGRVLGTPDFMPPEQRRDAKETDQRSDLWSLGATLYQMVTGKSPRVIRLQDLPQGLQTVLDKALQEAKEHRYQTAHEFRDALRTCLEVRPATPLVPAELGSGECPQCQTVNEPRRKFCRKCAASLRVRCLKCGVEIPVWDDVCGECGAKQAETLASLEAELKSLRAESERLLSQCDFEQATQIASKLAAEQDRRLQPFKDWADAFLKTVAEEKSRQEENAQRRFEEAKKHRKAFDYHSAISALEIVPESVRTREMAIFLDDLRAERAEAKKLMAEIRERVKARQLDGLLSQVNRAVELRGDRPDLQRLKQQLEEREERLASERLERELADLKERELADLKEREERRLRRELTDLKERKECLARLKSELPDLAPPDKLTEDLGPPPDNSPSLPGLKTQPAFAGPAKLLVEVFGEPPTPKDSRHEQVRLGYAARVRVWLGGGRWIIVTGALIGVVSAVHVDACVGWVFGGIISVALGTVVGCGYGAVFSGLFSNHGSSERTEDKLGFFRHVICLIGGLLGAISAFFVPLRLFTAYHVKNDTVPEAAPRLFFIVCGGTFGLLASVVGVLIGAGIGFAIGWIVAGITDIVTGTIGIIKGVHTTVARIDRVLAKIAGEGNTLRHNSLRILAIVLAIVLPILLVLLLVFVLTLIATALTAPVERRATSSSAPPEFTAPQAATALASPRGQKLPAVTPFESPSREVRCVRTLTGTADRRTIGFYGLAPVAFSRSGNTVAVAGKDAVEIRAAQDGALRQAFGRTPTKAIAFSPDGRIRATIGHAATGMVLWDTSNGSVLNTLNGSNLHCAAFSPDGQSVAAAGSGVVKLWDVASGALVRTLAEPKLMFDSLTKDYSSLAFSPDGAHLAAVARSLTVWDVRDGALLRTVEDEDSTFRLVEFSPDGNMLAIGALRTQKARNDWQRDRDAVVMLWDARSWTKLHTFRLCQRINFGITAVAFAPDSRTIAAGSGDTNTLFLWDIPTKRKTIWDGPSGAVLGSPGDPDHSVTTPTSWGIGITSVAFSLDGATLVSGTGDGTVKFWDVKPLLTEGVVTNSIGMKLTLIPAGEFMMGSPESAEEQAKAYVEYYGVPPADAERTVQFFSDLFAAEYRLPTEAEWEYACRAGTTTRFRSLAKEPR